MEFPHTVKARLSAARTPFHLPRAEEHKTCLTPRAAVQDGTAVYI